LQEGWYLVGSGNTGAASALATCAALYGSVMLLSSMTLRRPYEGYKV